MKRKHILMSALILSALTFTSCEDFLDTSSKTDMNSETAYSTPGAAGLDLIGCYDGWQRTISDEGVGMYLTAEFASDQAFAGLGLSDAKNNNVLDQFDTGLAPSYNDMFNTDWVNYYKAIFRCNKLIQADATINWNGDTKTEGRIMGEARAIRAILYFDLARLFGDVPLLLVPTEENVPRTPAKEVYQAIFDDLKYAAENIPADAYPLSDRNTNDGRITKYAAEALLARAYLYYTGYYGEEHPACSKAEATAAINDVVENGGYELEENYKDFWMPSSDITAESKTVTGDVTKYNWQTTYAGKWYDGDGWKSGQGNLSKEIVLNMKFAVTQNYDGDGDGNTFSVYLGPRNRCANDVHIASGWGACSVTPAFVEQYKNDPRFSACVWSCQDAGFTADEADTYEYTGYYTRKYAPMCFSDGTRQEVGFKLGIAHQNLTYYQDYTIMRYADVLLMHSELNGNDWGLNKVRARVGLEAVDYSIENIRKERAIELAFEGVHYWDLMRYKKDGAYAAEAIAKAQNGAKVKNGGVDATTKFVESNFTSKKGLMQIPNTQITLSGKVLTQNPGW
ncbi:RagB/SusD family nutrient uptake outer membrane protein [Segatella copri]|uniref:RagB/SusD family nutrient uptake outer membrane protein n=1 Tax=Segatella copri TaxID=165179 RepID=UPI00294B1A43|nr:RagB/SusD family nutrient uptake outer membrane protein [Segatella copri]WOF88673.1 RagB/SusD family nutrient uptake outer membrane protein [Segatella copri]WOF94821.1 RagB/SusD family nutrient uptake outer membrane protein [Segatella copri]WOG33050.1 RagB/SusD family nutrient uptake outer membrane protein [Segatella copri]